MIRFTKILALAVSTVFLSLTESLSASEGLVVGLVDVCGTNGVAGVPAVYVRALERAGQVPVVLPRTADFQLITDQVRRVDLVLLCGGEDIDPALYRTKKSAQCERVNANRDAFEWKVLDACVKLRCPIFGICRGEQVINAYFGGTLYQDINTEVPGVGRHRHAKGEKKTYVDHEIEVIKGSRLSKVLGQGRLSVKAWHHQSVRELAPGFRVSAIAPDGVIEAIESDGYPAAGLQFHPEVSVKADPSSRLLDVFRNLDVLCGSRTGICVLSNTQNRVEVELTGARIVSWRDDKGQERLFMPEKKLSDGGEWSHGGIPLCWPWFGRKDGAIHGFVRNKRFLVVRRTADELLLRYSLAAEEEPSFPHKVDIDVEIRLRDGLSVALRTHNTGAESFDLACGIHPYFAVSDYGKLIFDGVEQAPFACVHGMDKAFPRSSSGDFRMTDEVLKQTLSLHSSGNSHIILWSPGTVEPCNRNLRQEDMTRFVGYGPALIKAAGTLVLQPGEVHTMSLQMSL